MAPHGLPSDGLEHKWDFPPLILEHKPRSKRTVTLVDLDVDVYGLDEIKGSTLPISAIVSSGQPNACASSADAVLPVWDLARLHH